MKCERPEIRHLLLLHLVGPYATDEPVQELAEHLAACSECREIRAASLPLAEEEAPFLDAATIERLAGVAVAETKRFLADSLASRSDAAGDGAARNEAALRHAERDYEILERLGEGGQATVYKARHRATGRLVALKCAFAETSWLEREARIAGQLEGSLFRRVEHVSKEGYAVLELCDGSLRDLLETVKGKGLPLERVRAISDRVLQGLETAHARGIVHGDLKPGNVLLTDGVAKVADFGLSLEEPDAGALIQSHTTRSSKSFAGTPQYLPPELRRGVKADVYAFGRTLAEMLTGRSAATSASPSVLRPDLGPAWDKLLANLTDEDPEKRMTAREARAAIAALGARPPRRGWKAASCLIALVGLVPIAGFVLATSPAAPPPTRPVFVTGREAGAIVPTPAPSMPPLPTPPSTQPLAAPAPRVQLETDAPLTSQRSVVFRVRSSDATELRLRREGGQSLDLDRRADGSAETALALPEGPSHIEVFARGPGGEAVASVDVTVDRTPPLLTLDDVAPLISVVSSEPLSSLIVNGVERAGGTRWTIATPEEGEVLSVRAVDRAGNVTTVSHRVHPRLPPGLRFGREIGGVPVYLWALPAGAVDLEIVRVRSGGRPFWLGRVAVTWRQYRAFVRATGRSEPPAPRFAVTDEHPVVNVSFADALAFARWAKLALPDEDDFSRAAGSGRYPWGDAAPDAGGVWRANFGPGVDASENGRDGFIHTAPVGSFPEGVSADGAADLAGNVAEWVVPLRDDGSKPVWGGSWGSPREDLERPARKLVPGGEPRQTVGFRCCIQ